MNMYRDTMIGCALLFAAVAYGASEISGNNELGIDFSVYSICKDCFLENLSEEPVRN